MAQPNPVAPFTAAVFAAACLMAVGVVASCEVRASKSGECTTSYLTGLGMVLTGAGMKAANDVGFQTINPALDAVRKAQLQEAALMEPTSGAMPPEPPPEPDWLAMDVRLGDAVAAFAEEKPEVLPVWDDDALPAPAKDEPLAARMARAAAKLPRNAKP